MKRIIHALVLAAVFGLFAISSWADDLAKLEGKWSVKKTNKDGQSYTQVLEIKKDKFKFSMLAGGGEVFIYAEGDIKLSKLGAFSAVKFFNIKGGSSADQIEPIDDDHESIYVLEENSWTITSNFDKPRDDQKPTADAYIRVRK